MATSSFRHERSPPDIEQQASLLQPLDSSGRRRVGHPRRFRYFPQRDVAFPCLAVSSAVQIQPNLAVRWRELDSPLVHEVVQYLKPPVGLTLWLYRAILGLLWGCRSFAVVFRPPLLMLVNWLNHRFHVLTPCLCQIGIRFLYLNIRQIEVLKVTIEHAININQVALPLLLAKPGHRVGLCLIR